MSRYSGDELMAIGTDIYNKWFKRFKCYRDDIIMEAVSGILRAEGKYDESKGYAFSTFVYKCAKNSVVAFLMRESRFSEIVADVDLDDVDFMCECDFYVDDCDYAGGINKLKEWADNLKPNMRAVAINMLNGKKCQTIANEYGVSRQRISEISNRVKDKIRDNFRFVEGDVLER